MKSNIIAYLMLWLPAAIVTYLFSDVSMTSQIIQWITATLMLLGWGVATGNAAYKSPALAFAIILFYNGFNIFLIALLYRMPRGSAEFAGFRVIAGLFSYRPLEIYITALSDFKIPHELVMVLVINVICIIGYIVGLVLRRIKPNPYRPKMVNRS